MCKVGHVLSQVLYEQRLLHYNAESPCMHGYVSDFCHPQFAFLLNLLFVAKFKADIVFC